MEINISTFLTLFRLICSPLFLPFLIVYTDPFQSFYVNLAVALFFLMLSFTDFLDGYIARKYKQTTVFGAMLDPIADKFLSYAALISLVTVGKLYFYWAIILIGREFFIMSLRMVALQQNISIPVVMMGKVKTVMQTVLIAMLILNPFYIGASHLYWNLLVYLVLVSVLLLSVVSAYRYTRTFMNLYAQSNENV